jgi:hypothetical protein
MSCRKLLDSFEQGDPPPPWLAKPWRNSALHAVSLTSVWPRVLAKAARHRRLLPEDLAVAEVELLDLTLTEGVYHFSDLAADRLICPVDPDLVALPPANHSPVDVGKFLPWFLSQMFSPDHIHLLFKPRHEVPAEPPEPMFDYFSSLDARVRFYRKLHARGMMDFSSTPLVVNGWFGLWKNLDQTSVRTILDKRRGNGRLITTAEFNRLYEALRATDPERADREGAPATALALFNPRGFADLPGGGFIGKYESDLSDFFHCFLAPFRLALLQGCVPVDSSLLGIPGLPPGLVWPYTTTLAMGGRFSMPLAQASHDFLMRPLSSPTFYRRPEQASAEHREVLRRLSELADEAGFVALREVPAPFMERAVAGLDHLLPALTAADLAAALPGDMRVPLSSLALERVDPSDAAPGLIYAPALDLRAPDLRVALWAASERAAAEGWGLVAQKIISQISSTWMTRTLWPGPATRWKAG